MRITCALFGHAPTYQRGAARVCICDRVMFQEKFTRIRHVLSCFLGGHRYIFVQERDGHEEFRCTLCGHPLLFQTGSNAIPSKKQFTKKVRYLCNLLGHVVHTVTQRNSLHEYACFCGHTFLKEDPGANRISHPLICLFAGHFVYEISFRMGLAEFLCRNCGHTFLLEGALES